MDIIDFPERFSLKRFYELKTKEILECLDLSEDELEQALSFVLADFNVESQYEYYFMELSSQFANYFGFREFGILVDGVEGEYDVAVENVHRLRLNLVLNGYLDGNLDEFEIRNFLEDFFLKSISKSHVLVRRIQDIVREKGDNIFSLDDRRWKPSKFDIDKAIDDILVKSNG